MLKNNDLKFKFLLVTFAFALVLILSIFMSSSVIGADQANAAAGSADDPIISLSYITKVFKPQIEQLIDQKVADKLKDYQPANNSTPSTIVQNTYVMSEGASVSYVVLELTKGQKLRVKSGSLEFILRPGGSAVVVSDSKIQGIADLTTGDELYDGNSLPINHSLLIPRADSRAISVTSVIAYIMVRGDYEIFE